MRRLLPSALLCFTLACTRESPAVSRASADSSALAVQPASPAADSGLIRGTPPGDLENWVADMRAGLDTAAAEVKTDRAAAQKRVVDLYASRQEYSEMYYGENGRMGPTPELAESIKTAETRFHELMALLMASPPATEQAIRDAITKTQQQLARVAELSKGAQRRLRSADTTEAGQ